MNSINVNLRMLDRAEAVERVARSLVISGDLGPEQFEQWPEPAREAAEHRMGSLPYWLGVLEGAGIILLALDQREGAANGSQASQG